MDVVLQLYQIFSFSFFLYLFFYLFSKLLL